MSVAVPIVFCRGCGDGDRPEVVLLLMSSDQYGALNANFIDWLNKFVVQSVVIIQT